MGDAMRWRLYCIFSERDVPMARLYLYGEEFLFVVLEEEVVVGVALDVDGFDAVV